MTKEKIGNSHLIKCYTTNKNNEDYIDNLPKLNKISKNETYIIQNKNLTNNLNRKNQKSIKFNRCVEQIRKNQNEANFKKRISRETKDQFNEINEKEKYHIIHLKKNVNIESKKRKIDKKHHQYHEIDMTTKKGNLNNYGQNLGYKDKINNDNNSNSSINQDKTIHQRYFESTLRNYKKENKEEMYDENTKLINPGNGRRAINNQTKNLPILNCFVQKGKKENNKGNDNLLKIKGKRDDDIIKKENKEFNYKKNKSHYNDKKNNFQKNVKKDEKNSFPKFTILEKCDNFLFSLLKKNDVKLFSKLEIKNIELFLPKEEKNKKNMNADDKLKELITIIDEYGLSENEIKEYIKILSSRIKPIEKQPISIDRFEISCENYKKKSIDFDNIKIKKTISDEIEQKNANDNISTNYYNNDEIDYKGNGNICDVKSQKKKSKKRQKFEEEKQKEKLEKEEPRNIKMYGFRNDGNNCYLNSSLQLLTRIKELKEEVFNFNEHYDDNDTQGRLIIEFKTLLQQIENSKDKELTLNPGRLKRVMGNVDEKYKSNYQEDSNEFIANFISALLSETGNKDKIVKKLKIVNESEKRPYENLYKKFFQRKGDSFVLDLFYGILKVTKKCNKCDNINSIKFNAYNMLEFPLINLTKKNDNKDLNLKQLFDNLTEEKKYEETCNNCNSDEVYSKTTIYTLPQYLIISFGRICDGNYYSNNIQYPKNIKIKGEFKQEIFSYILECVIEHSGGLGGGHYTSLIPTDKNNDNWIRYSDSYCSGNNYGFESRNAIILLYKLK